MPSQSMASVLKHVVCHLTLRSSLPKSGDAACVRRPNIAVAKLAVTEGRVVLVNSDRAVSAHRWLSPRTDGGAFTFSGSAPEMIFSASRSYVCKPRETHGHDVTT